MFMVGIDSKYVSEATTREEAIEEARQYFMELLERDSRGDPNFEVAWFVEEGA